MRALATTIFILIAPLMSLQAHQVTDSVPVAQNLQSLQICSFNIQFLGTYSGRDNQALANLIKDSECDLVAIQELVAPPDLTLFAAANQDFAALQSVAFPDGTAYQPDKESTDFFEAMEKANYSRFWLSDQDTGTSVKNKSNGSNTEWWVVFYKPEKVQPNMDELHVSGFLDGDITRNKSWDRVPYAFCFKSLDGKFDFVLINVHLHPGSGPRSRQRRKVELEAIYKWVDQQKEQTSERDFIVLGDMNIENGKELEAVLGETSYISLNTNAEKATNTNIFSPKPYDHVMLNPEFTAEVPSTDNFEVVNLMSGLQSYWMGAPEQYPGADYNHNAFRMLYSDHHLIKFKVNIPEYDDD